MKKQYFLLLTVLSLNLLIFSGCKKESAPVPKTKTQLITQSTWKFKSAFAGSINIGPSLQPCQIDNILTFVSNGTGTLDEGSDKCDPADPQIRPFTWSFQTNETILFISATLFTGGSNTFNLVSLSETELVVSQTYTPPVGPSLLVTVTFNH